MTATRTGKATTAKLVVLCLTIAFVPCLRSCGDLSFGFPAVAYAVKDPPIVSQRSVALPRFRPANALLDLAAVGLLAAGLVLLYRTRRSERARALVRAGVQGLAVYQALVVIGYAVLYPIAIRHQGDDALTAFIAGYAYFIHPYFAATSYVAQALPEGWQASALFGDEDDLPMRLGYALMWAAWFGLGTLRLVFTKREAPAPEVMGT